jgi:chromosome segregation ATPase
LSRFEPCAFALSFERDLLSVASFCLMLYYSQMQELENTQQDLEASHNEIRTISEQLTVAVKLSLKLETQLNEARSAYQTTKTALVEERKVTAAAKNQLATSQRSLIAEKNSVKALRGSVDQALQALQELNQDSVALADELDKAKKQIANHESESASVRQKLVKEKEASAQLRASSAQGEIARQKGKLLEQKRALQQAETRLKMIPQVC